MLSTACRLGPFRSSGVDTGLRLEFDDRPELAVEVEISAGVEVRDLSADLSGE
ncbi:hypothetical protein Pd630_LPD04380 [Rhodococcus opacus PD630]|nr:hypothetical protein Pd630_LPD04380 [Rhodococcus opacus PD630]